MESMPLVVSEPKSWRIGTRTVTPCEIDDEDERGLLFVWEEPRQYATYVVSIDPTVGRPGWSREFRTEADVDTDNAAIEVFRAGVGGQPDVQVAEFAAPVDAIDIAPIAATIGTLYGGSNEDGQALLIGEVTGPGAVTLRELVDRFQYTNLWQWTQWGSAQVRRTQQFWWYSSRSSNKDLWMRGLHHIQKYRCRLQSKWLIEEMADCIADAYLLIGEARYGRHDDRVMAMLFNLWALHDWSTREDLEPIERPVDTNAPKWEASDISYDGMMQAWDDHIASLLDD
jgi:hypothetical protein